MSKPLQSHSPVASTSNASFSIPLGPQVSELLSVAYRARRNVLLEGSTGIGKSDIVRQFANEEGLEFRVLDLSLLEPPDLVGLPIIEDGRTHYAIPSELPTEGRGILMLEELNRAEIPVMQPALQLLSARQLHNYQLPPGWFCVAAVNPSDGEYQVTELDPALRSRFLQIRVHADPGEWLKWADNSAIHSIVTSFIRDFDESFAAAPPRSWAYASDVIHALKPEEFQNPKLIRALLEGYLPSTWALAVTESVGRAQGIPSLDMDFLERPDAKERLQALVQDALGDSGRTDLVFSFGRRLRWLFGTLEFETSMREERVTATGVREILRVLPGDIQDLCLEDLASALGHPKVVKSEATLSESVSDDAL